VVQWTDNGTADHLWHFMPMGNGQYNIENMLTHQVLGVSNASTADGAQIVQWSDSGTRDHLWTVTQAADGNFLIQNVNSGKYLEAYMASTSTQATIDQWGLTNCTCQEWQLVNTQVSPYPAPRAVAGNGIFVHDPYMLRDTAGKYWLYGSHQTLATSTDGTNFTMYTNCTTAQMGGYAPNCPPIGPDFSSWNGLQTPKGWNNGANTDVWAPSLMVSNGTYYQYYSIPYLPSTRPLLTFLILYWTLVLMVMAACAGNAMVARPASMARHENRRFMQSPLRIDHSRTGGGYLPHAV
jgi:arabinan endo-1,5-alpha-L-arabinosidase